MASDSIEITLRVENECITSDRFSFDAVCSLPSGREISRTHYEVAMSSTADVGSTNLHKYHAHRCNPTGNQPVLAVYSRNLDGSERYELQELLSDENPLAVEIAAQRCLDRLAERHQTPFRIEIQIGGDTHWRERGRMPEAVAPAAEPAADRKCTCPWDRLYANGCKCGGK